MSLITNQIQRTKYSLLLFAVLNLSHSFAQLFSFDNYSVKDGLVQSNVRGIAQDSYGNIWLGTDGGLSKFDGNTFQNYFSSDSIVGDNVSTLFKDKNESIWIGYVSGSITRYCNNSFKILKSDVFPKGSKVLTIFIDSKNSLWISFQNFGVVKIIDPTADWNNSKNYKIYKTREGLSAVVVSIVETKNNDLYFVTDIGIKHFLNDKNGFEFFKVKGFEGVQATGMLEDTEGNLWISYYLGGPGMLLRTNPKTHEIKTFMLSAFVSHLISDEKGNIWGATWGNGIIKYDAKKNKLITFNATNGLSSEKNYCMMQDWEGNIFIGSQNNGFYIFKGERFVTYNALSGLAGEQVNAVTADANNNLWMGTNAGLSKLNTEDNNIRNYEKANGLEFDTRTLAKDNSGNLWIGTSNQKLIHFNVETNRFSPVSLVNNFISSTLVNTLVFDQSGKLWVGTIGSGLSVYDPSKNTPPKCFTVEDGFYGQSVTINALLCDHTGNMWVAVEGRGLAKFENGTFKLFSKEHGLSKSIISSLAEDANGNIWIGTSGDGIFIYNGKLFQHINTKDGLLSNLVNSIVVDENTNIWIGTNKGLSKYISKDSIFISYVKKDGFSSIETKPNAVFADKKGTIWFGTVNGLIKYNAEYDYLNTRETQLTITGVKVNYTESLELNKHHELPYNHNTITFNYNGVCISNPDAVKYSVMLSGDEENWRPISAEKSVIYSNLPPGNYTFKVKASNNLGVWNKKPVTFSFRINPPWYFTWWAYLTYLVFGTLVFFSYVKWRERKLIVEKSILEQKVKERTIEIVNKNHELDEKNKDIMASIRYAKRIQDAILPPNEYVRKNFPQTFILYKPKDVVSGDFYWLHDIGDKILFAAVDCTGHGVPGAFMSIVGHNHLEQIVGTDGLTQPAAILDALNKRVSETLRQSNAEDQVKDGMDIALCMYNRTTQEFQYAGAYNPLYWIRNGKLNEIKANKFPIGDLRKEQNQRYINHSISLEKGDTLYIFSDGYADQFGGAEGKKLKYGGLKKLLLEIQHLNMDEQKVFLDKAIEEWKGKLEQIDDILVIGTRL